MSSDSFHSFLLGWPEVPRGQDRPRSIYVACSVPDEISSLLSTKGWTVIDVRTMPRGTDGEKGECVKAWLGGVRLGSIEAGVGIVKFVELEAKIYGLLASKVQGFDTPQIDNMDLDKLLSFGSTTSTANTGEQNVKRNENKRRIQKSV